MRPAGPSGCLSRSEESLHVFWVERNLLLRFGTWSGRRLRLRRFKRHGIAFRQPFEAVILLLHINRVATSHRSLIETLALFVGGELALGLLQHFHLRCRVHAQEI